MKKLVIEIPCDEFNSQDLKNEASQLLIEWLRNDIEDVIIKIVDTE